MRRHLLVCVLSLSPLVGAAAQQSFCFELGARSGGKRLSMVFADDRWQRGSVQYAGQKEHTDIRKTGEEVLSRVPVGRPWNIRYRFEESVGGKPVGIYSFSLQGASFSDISYLRLSDRKKFALSKWDGDDAACLAP